MRELRENTESKREILIDDSVKEKHIKKNKLMQTDGREEKKDDKRTVYTFIFKMTYCQL